MIDGICAPACLLFTNDAKLGGAKNVSGTTASVSIQNTQPNNYVHFAFNTTTGSPAITESAKICCGGGAGLNICTNSAHPIVSRTGVDEPGAPTSMQIPATGTRDVEISAPLKVKSFLSTFENGMSVGTAMPTSAIALAVTGQGAFGGSLTVFGNLTVNGFIAAKPYASLRVGTSGGTP